ncbi:carboxymuconolactone decarboxylase family protein [Sphingomonas sp. BK235]|uniref:carboxymuconolactone decarboxylase family protein n=1 Tax=Sphingomonas sp. BK235 TaxID=2512131 RepID=UPI00104CC3BD|nr:carboxymuconolactone decarboxylase family protein [Sphingomonas sp. BK235]TCP33675.1 AhpD family alkylhydroperoxidase [Sphingomonas sp. BK235]
MTPRIQEPHALAPEAIKAMMTLEQAIAHAGLDPVLLELVKLRVSQLNGCAFCLHMHATDLRRRGEPELRLYLLSAWRESTLYSARERAALGWAESLTLLPERQASDADYAALSAHFDERERVWLTMAIGAINVWNRLQVGFRVAHPGGAG